MSKKSDSDFSEELFKKHRQMMFKIAFGILHNKSDAEDAVQEAFLWIINNLDIILQVPCNKQACYFAKISEHISLNMINKQRNHPTYDIDQCKEIRSDISTEKESEAKITIEEIKKIIRTMAEEDRIILRLYLFEEKNYREISEITGITEVNARVRVHRARKKLAKLLKERGIDYEY